jgi:hypothetical protein
VDTTLLVSSDFVKGRITITAKDDGMFFITLQGAAIVLEVAVGKYSLDDICSGPDIDDMRYSSYDKAINAVEKRIDVLKQIRNARLVTSRNYWISKLKESIPHLKYFFGVEN